MDSCQFVLAILILESFIHMVKFIIRGVDFSISLWVGLSYFKWLKNNVSNLWGLNGHIYLSSVWSSGDLRKDTNEHVFEK